MSLTIVDLGYGNIGSIAVAFERLGATPRLTADRAEIAAASHVVLPGVGAAGHAMDRMRGLGLAEFLPVLARPLLGICLGMQLLFEASEEDDASCLGILPGTVRRMASAPGAPVPRMGWCRLEVADPALGLADGDYAYFAHSYACPPGPAVRAEAEGVPAVVREGNVTGAQFHPERSGEAGARFLAAFLAS